MKILPNPTLQKWLTEKNLGHLLPGFEVPDDVFAKAMRQAKKSQPHATTEEQEAWAAYTAVHQAPKPEKGSYRVFTVADRWTWLWRIAVLLTLWAILALSTFGQPAGPSYGVTVQFRNNAGTILGTKAAGLVIFKCGAGATTCDYTGNTFSFNFAGGGAGCTTAGSAGQVLTDNGAGGCTSNANLTFSSNVLGVTGRLSIAQGTIVSALAGIDHTVTWNNAAVTFTAHNVAVTDTASASGSLLFDYSVGGASKGRLTKAGVLDVALGFRIAGAATSGRYLKGDGTDFVVSSGAASGTGNGGACSNQVLTNVALNSDAAPTNTCTTLTKAFLPATVVHTDQANTWTTGAQDLTAASSLLVPASGGYAPTADGSFGYDTTQDKWVGGGAGGLTGSFVRFVGGTNCTTEGTCTTEADTTGTAGDQIVDDTSTTTEKYFKSAQFTVPANFLIARKKLRINISVESVTGASAPNMTYRLRWGGAGGTVLMATTTSAPTSSATRSQNLCYIVEGTAAAGASVSIMTGSCGNTTNSSFVTGQPITALATNSSQVIILSGQWSANAANTHTVRVLSVSIEELN